LAQLHEGLSFRTLRQEGELVGEVKLGDATCTVRLKEYDSADIGAIRPLLAAGSLVRFEAEHNSLQAEFGIGFVSDKVAFPIYIGLVCADVIYKQGSFQLANARFVPHPEYQ